MTAWPSKSGNPRSSRIRSGRRQSQSRSASRTSPASSTSWPRARRLAAIAALAASSSSTMRTTAAPSLMRVRSRGPRPPARRPPARRPSARRPLRRPFSRFGILSRESDDDRQSAQRALPRVGGTSHRLRQTPDHCQTDPGAPLRRRTLAPRRAIEPLEQARQHGRGNPRSRVFDHEIDAPWPRLTGRDPDPPARRVPGRVLQQVGQDLVHEHRVRPHGREARRRSRPPGRTARASARIRSITGSRMSARS